MKSLRSNPWALALLASLVLNLFLAGLLAGRILSSADRMDAMFRHYTMRWATRVLGDEGRPLMDQVWSRHNSRLEPRLQELRASRKGVADVLATEPFDAQALARAFDRLSAATQAAQQALHPALVELAGLLTPAQRKRLAAADYRKSSSPKSGAEPPRK
ncbi:MAG: periplasmic heavy metal sensor [Candidatus Lambdaproteobacteria bacterium]|nr:periplasmic heavy metal sensor [Candidatus Lambdaproteobacteria bacterium]